MDVKELSVRRARLVSKSTKQHFQLDPHSGNVILKDKMDREALCGQKDPCVLHAEIVLENPLQVHRIEVEIEDVNDNSPQFSKKEFLFAIPEQTLTNTRFPVESAEDLDKGENAVQNYTLNHNDHFWLDVQSHPDGSRYAELVLQKHLDREKDPQLFLILSAIDGGTPRRTGTANIIIDVLDANDNAPHFHQSLYNVKIMENTQADTVIIKVEAMDRDLGTNAEITYSFGQISGNVLRSFKLNQHTGELTVSGTIDYEVDKNYALNIKATDGGGLSDYCKVIVEVEDSNDNAPEVTVTSITSPFPEDSPVDTVVALFSIMDQDSGDNGRTACTIESDLPFMLKATVNSYYQLVTQQLLDRERVSEYNITITATDWGSPRLTSTRIINVRISDVNDNSPVFEKSYYELPIVENNIPGLLIGLVHADDLDTEQNAKVSYSLLPGKVSDQSVSSYVSINSETGNLYAIRSLDYEQVKDFQVTMRAMDSGSPPLSSEVIVRVVVMDENDNAPFILYPLQNGTSPSNDLVPRGAETDYLVTKVVAVDRDSGQNSWLTYELLKATEPGLFSVGPQNGEVKTMRPINKRDTIKQKLIIGVRDNGHPPQSTSATLSILLVDGFSDPYMKMMDTPKDEVVEEEDRTLTMYLVICLAVISFIFLISLLVFFAIKIHKRRKFIESSVLSFPVGPNFPEICGDVDGGSLSRAYNYELCLAGQEFRTEEEEQGSNLGESGSMDDTLRIMKGLYLLFLLSLSGVVCVSIRYSLPEEKKSGSLVANVLKDLKLGPGELSARRAQLVSKSNNQYFQLDTRSGNVIVNEKIDREALCGEMDPCLLLSEILLQDPLKIYSIETQIEDVNDNSPEFSKNEFELAIPEQVPASTRFPLESAQDADLGENSVQNYTLSPNENFRLELQNESSGKKYLNLVLEKPLDREKEAQFWLTLTAVDGGVPQRTGTVQIKINVLDSNDNFPQFTQSEYKVKLKENSPRGTLVFKVEARDLDFGSNAEITYSFHRVPEKISNLFQLHQMNGEIIVMGPIDYEKEASYHINIKATDGGGLSGHCKVLVEIEDENDNAPEISVRTITSPLAEDSPLDTLVVLFSITDRDSGDNGRTSCSVEMNLPFLLKNTVNNYYQLVTQSPLDREKVPEYNITITATDWGSPRLTSRRTIRVLISDINDNSPVFQKSRYEMQVWENNIPGLLMGSVHAVDLDMEQNAKVTYSLVPGNTSGAPAASYVSINSEMGNLYVLRSLDYEQIKEFQVRVRASDGGSPPLTSEVVVQVVILDENDNAPFFLYPLQNSTSPFNELVPKSVEASYLVAKVVAVDGDSGQNSWLSYELLKATDPTLFSIGAQNGEIKTRRPLTERDTNKQRLIILVRDNGHPPQTSTATLNILPVDGFSDPYLNIASVSHEASEEDSSLTMYLVICLAAVSFVFLICIIVFVAIKVLKKDSSFITALPQFPPALPEIPENSVDSQSGSLSRTYQYDVCLASGSLSSDFRFLRPLIPVFSMGDPNISENHRISSVSQEASEQAEGQKPREQVS
ncbi:UNVERIFIED_CONTAM: hypothetical protein K2H54_016402 [Gekko kuhli]